MAGTLILPLEETLIEQALSNLDKKRAGIPETFADGVLRGIDSEALGMSERYDRLAGYSGATIVAYPDETEERVTLGSRVTIERPGRTSVLDIVGCPSVHDATGAVKPASLGAVLVEAIIGKRVGEAVQARSNGSSGEARIVAIDQLAMSNADIQTR
jgi:hypothetical protein